MKNLSHNFVFETSPDLGSFFNSPDLNFLTLNLKKGRMVIGFAELVLVQEKRNFKYLYIKYIYVNPKLRSNGYGAKILERIEEIAQEYKVDLIRGDLDLEKTTLTKRIKFFQKAGYTLVKHHSHEAIDVFKKINPKSPLDQYLTKSFKLGNSYHT